MRTISKSRLKSHMLEEFRKIERTGEIVCVTDHGKPVLQIQRLDGAKKSAAEVFAGHRGRVVYHDDVLKDTSAEWQQR